MAFGDEILAWRKAAEQENAKPPQIVDCPVCDWTLTKSPDGTLHCKYCGWHDGGLSR